MTYSMCKVPSPSSIQFYLSLFSSITHSFMFLTHSTFNILSPLENVFDIFMDDATWYIIF